MKLTKTKICACCGRNFESIPMNHKFSIDEFFGGFYWDCSCGSTLFVAYQLKSVK